MNNTIATIATLIALGSNPASAGFYDGAQLAEWCSDPKPLECNAYIIGSVDQLVSLSAIRGLNVVCMPLHVTVAQAVAIVRKYLDDNPQGWHFSASSIITNAFHESFPCPAQ